MEARWVVGLALLLQITAAGYAFFQWAATPAVEAVGKEGAGSREAYATLLCNDAMEEAAAVLVFSLRQTGTTKQIVVLTMPEVSERVGARLRALGGTVHRVGNPVEYPWRVTEARAAIAKPCRYSKLKLWGMTDYRRIVYLDADMLVLRSLDHLFLGPRPQLTAVPDSLPPDRFNSGLMVLHPNASVFEDMLGKVSLLPSPNVGDQGFLNEYFHDWYREGGKLHYGYNALVRVSQFSTWDAWVEPKLLVLHFSGLGKPWNLVQDPRQPSTRRYDGMWWDAFRMMLRWEAANGTEVGGGLSRPMLRHSALCMGDFMAYSQAGAGLEQLSVVVFFGEGGEEGMASLKGVLEHYDTMDVVERMFVVWGSPKTLPEDPKDFGLRTPVDVKYSGRISLNDKFRPIANLGTACVLVVDSVVRVGKAALMAAFHAWKKDSYRVVGFSAAAYSRDIGSGELVYGKPGRGYSLVTSDGGMVMHADYFRAYTCDAPQELRDYVDEVQGCDDIAINFLASHLSGSTPLLVFDPAYKRRRVQEGGVDKSACLNRISSFLGFKALKSTSETIFPLELVSTAREHARLANLYTKRRSVRSRAQ